MRPLELVSLVALALALLTQWVAASSLGMRRALVGAVLGAMGLSAVIEGARWQLAPAYVLAAVAAFAARRAPGSTPASGARRLLRVAPPLTGLALASCLPAILPVPSLPAPGGPHAVGTVTFVLEDGSREDTAAPGGHRRFMAQAWYPASPSAVDTSPAPYMPDVGRTGPALAGGLGLPSFFADHLALARSHAHTDAPFASALGRAPLIVYSHGLGAVRALGTTTAEELASRGYVVIGLDHTHDAAAVAFPDGEVVARSFRPPPSATEEAQDRLKASWVRVRAADVRFLLDALAGTQVGPIPEMLVGHADVSRVGIVGHSLGGATAVEVCRTDQRAAACADLDGAIYGEAERATLAQPFLRIDGDLPLHRSAAVAARERLLVAFEARARGPACRLHVAGAAHGDFTDMAALSPLLPYLTPLVAKRGRKETLQGANEVVAAFFDATLRDDATGWARVTAPRPRFDAACRGLPAP